MTTIIKATDHNAAIQHAAFNFDDMAGQANAYLANVRHEALGIVAKAQQEADAVSKQAQAEGYKNVENIVRRQLEEKLQTLLPALAEVIQNIHDAKQAWLTHWEKNAVHVAAAIAGRIVQRELAQTPEITLQLVRDALELAAGSAELTIRLNPADYETLGSQVERLSQEISGLAPAKLVADPRITAGGCRLDTQFGTIDQQIEAQLERIKEELT